MDTSYLVGAHVQSLLDVMPDPTTDNGVFTYLQTLEYIDPASNNLEYLYNRSGDKVPSPLVSRLADGDVLDSESLARLGTIIRLRYANKWDKLWADYASQSGLFNNIDVTTTTTYGKAVSKSGTDTLTKSGTETSRRTGTETREESYPQARKSTREISGGYTDTRAITNVRTGAENTTESYPTARTSTKSITGGYADTDSTSSTRTGKETVTDKGETATTSYGFNSSSGVKTQKVGPDTSSGTTTETDYGSGIKDTRSGAITRAYNQYQEATTESGSRQLSTTYGENGLSDAESGNVNRVYNNYKDEVTESGSKRTETSYGSSGMVDEQSFNNRQDSRSTSASETNSGTDSTTQSGYNIRRLSDKLDILTAMYENPLLNNFYEIVYRDIDEVLTIPIFV